MIDLKGTFFFAFWNLVDILLAILVLGINILNFSSSVLLHWSTHVNNLNFSWNSFILLELVTMVYLQLLDYMYFGLLGSAGTISHTRSFLKKPGMISVYSAGQFNPNGTCIPSLTMNGRLIYSPKRQNGTIVSSVKTSEAKELTKSNGKVIMLWNWLACSCLEHSSYLLHL